MELSIVQLEKRFGSKSAVSKISVTLQPGVYGLLGANGAGKSTLMRMVCSILKPTSGQILFDGKNIEHLGEIYRSKLGYLPQDFGYYPDFTAKEYLTFIAAIKGITGSKAKKEVKQLLETVNLSDVVGKQIRTFSGGMKQRLGIAQAVINNPSILVLDEPTAGLDPKERMRFRNLISEQAKDKIVILSTHIVSDIDSIADDILMMKEGHLILNYTAENAVRSMDGKVWSCKLPQSQIEDMDSHFPIVNLRHEENNEALLRIVSDTKPHPNAIHVTPTLDDLYLYHFQEEIRRDET
ncbi:MAG: ABC transporter ATP-binding protein [Lachnospiraceae bacterium]|nr:ABC transporter ATP-binding protein [Lachnospiraceae bacterium]